MNRIVVEFTDEDVKKAVVETIADNVSWSVLLLKQWEKWEK